MGNSFFFCPQDAKQSDRDKLDALADTALPKGVKAVKQAILRL